MDKNYCEEYLSAITHYIAAGMTISGLILLIVHSLKINETGYLVGSIIFGLGLLFMYMMSGTYHIIQNTSIKRKFRVLDHIAIYVSISASYTPYLFTVLAGKIGWIIFSIQWGLTLIGIVFKIFFTGRFKLLSTLIYLFMGWMVLFIFKDLKLSLNAQSLNYLIMGGIVYSIGAIIYMLKNIKFNHVLWHLFVIGGSFYNYLSVLYIK